MKKLFVFLLIIISVISCSKEKPSSSPQADNSIKVVFSKNNDIVVADFDGSSFKNEQNLTNSTVPNWKPSWSKTGNKIVFFRYVSGTFPYSQASDIAYWKTKISIINSDGTGYRALTAGNYGDFNATFLRDGTNRIIFIRMIDPATNSWETWMTTTDASPGDEVKIYGAVAFSSLQDGRIAFAGNNNQIHLLDPDSDSNNSANWSTITVESPAFPSNVYFTRMSFSPDETKILLAVDFSLYTGTYGGMDITGDNDTWDQKDCVLYVADFNKTTLKITNARVISPRNNDFSYSDGYNRWSPDGKKIFFHSKKSGKFKMYRYDLENNTGPTLINTESDENYYFPCSENTPI